MAAPDEAASNSVPTLWQLLALSDDELEKTDLVVMNLAIAKEIPSLKDLDIPKYARIVDGWTEQFAKTLSGREADFRRTPSKWENDIRFFRIGMLQCFIGDLGFQYIPEQIGKTEVWYTNPGHLFLNGLIDTMQGTCGNLAALHVAMSRRLGWPVALATAWGHFFSRFDDGQVVYNIESTKTKPGFFSAGPDEKIIEVMHLPRKAVESGSDLRKLTAREMIGTFLALRGRHYFDTERWLDADTSYALSRALFPRYRRAWVAAMMPYLHRGETLFSPDEESHPRSFCETAAPKLAASYRERQQPVPASQLMMPTTWITPPPGPATHVQISSFSIQPIDILASHPQSKPLGGQL